jgi:signal transduction histidine kinase
VIADRHYVQGVLFDGQHIIEHLSGDFSDIRLSPLIDTQLQQTNDFTILRSLPFKLDLMTTPSDFKNRETLFLLGFAALLAFTGALSAAVIYARLAERRAAFVSAVTHELRTPLTSLRLHSDLLHDERYQAHPEKRQKSLNILRQQSRRLNDLIANVLDHARLERHRTPQLQPVIIEHCLANEHNRWQQRLAAANLNLTPPGNGATTCVLGDADAIIRVFDNLIENASKYAKNENPDQNSVAITIAKNHTWVAITIRDHGPGMPSTAQPRPFERSAEEAAGQAPGIGLGLDLCRRLARAMRGHLDIRNAKGGGVQATLRLRQCSYK